MADNTSTILSHTLSSISTSSSTSTTVRTRTVVSTIYIAGVAFMVGIFLLLLWVNLCSRFCRCWHETSVINRFNRQWLGRRSRNGTRTNSSSKTGQARSSCNDDELE